MSWHAFQCNLTFLARPGVYPGVEHLKGLYTERYSTRVGSSLIEKYQASMKNCLQLNALAYFDEERKVLQQLIPDQVFGGWNQVLVLLQGWHVPGKYPSGPLSGSIS